MKFLCWLQTYLRSESFGAVYSEIQQSDFVRQISKQCSSINLALCFYTLHSMQPLLGAWHNITLVLRDTTTKLFQGDYWERKFLSIAAIKKECFDKYNSLVIIGNLNGVSSRHERMSYNLKMTEIRWTMHGTVSIQLSPEGEVNSGGYIPRREASRYISTALHRPWGG